MQMPKSVTPSLLTALVAAGALIVGCGSDVTTPMVPDPVVISDGTESALGAVSALATEPVQTIIGCTCFVLGYDFTTTNCVSSLSSSGNETVSCLGRVSPAPAKTEVVFGQSCFLPQTGEYSTISRLIINSKGGASLRCQSK